MNPVVVHTTRHFLVNILVMKCTWPSEGSAKISIQVISAPKCPLPALQVDVVRMTAGVVAGLAVNPQGEHQMCGCPEEAPAVVDSRI